MKEPSEDVLRGLLSAAPDALVAVGGDGRIVFANEQAERLFGWTRSELLGRLVDDLVPERFRHGHPTLREGYTTAPATRPMGAGLDLWARRRDGSEFPAEISLSSIPTAEGTLTAAAIRDVTVSRRTEQRFRAVLASAPDAMVGVDATGRIQLVNEQAERLFGWDAADLVGLQVEVLVPDAAVDRHVRHRGGYVEHPQALPMGGGLQLSARRRDGSTFPAEVSLSAVTEARDEVLVLAAVRDVTERIEMEAERRRQALEAQRERSHRLESLGQLAGGVAHDFNNLLGVILNYSTLISMRADDDGLAGYAREIAKAAERGAGLTRQLLTFARRDFANPQPIDVGEVVRGVVDMLDRTLGERIDLDVDLTPVPTVVVADRHQLEQIVLNLALNSRDAMPDGGRLSIRTQRRAAAGSGDGRPSDVVLQVADTGRGMTADVAARAFEPFFTTKPAGQGTGLGLATVYGIVRRAGGEVAIESEAGSGTTVTVTLHGVDEDPVHAPSEVAHSRGGRGRVLLVEDEDALREVTAELLRGEGYEVRVAADGAEALAAVRADPGAVDVVLTDLVMPRLRGDELAAALAELRPDLPVVLMSGYDSGGTRHAGRVLPKPITVPSLLQALTDALEGRRN